MMKNLGYSDEIMSASRDVIKLKFVKKSVKKSFKKSQIIKFFSIKVLNSMRFFGINSELLKFTK